MAELVKKLHFKQDTVEQTAKAYSTTAEAGTEYITNKIDDLNCYIAVGNTLDNRATKGSIIKVGTTATKCILSSGRLPYNKVEYRTPGTYTVTFPPGITTAKITSAGAGGGGGGGAGFSLGGTGGQGALVTESIAVTSGNTLQVVVGEGGAGGRTKPYTSEVPPATDGSAGGTSSVLGVSAIGGGGGAKASWRPGENGTSYGNGGAGGAGGFGGQESTNGSNGNDGWVIIEYGGDI